MSTFRKTANFVWDVTDDILRVDYRPIEYGCIIILFVVLPRFESVSKPTKDKVCAKSSKLKNFDIENLDPSLNLLKSNYSASGVYVQR